MVEEAETPSSLPNIFDAQSACAIVRHDYLIAFRAERHNAAWRVIGNKATNELGIIGWLGVNVACGAATPAKNLLIKRCGAASAMSVFGDEITFYYD